MYINIFDLAKGLRSAPLLSKALERRGGHCKPLASKDGVKIVLKKICNNCFD